MPTVAIEQQNCKSDAEWEDADRYNWTGSKELLQGHLVISIADFGWFIYFCGNWTASFSFCHVYVALITGLRNCSSSMSSLEGG